MKRILKLANEVVETQEHVRNIIRCESSDIRCLVQGLFEGEEIEMNQIIDFLLLTSERLDEADKILENFSIEEIAKEF